MTDLQRVIEEITPEDLIDPPPVLRDLIEFLQAEFDKRGGIGAMEDWTGIEPIEPPFVSIERVLPPQQQSSESG